MKLFSQLLVLALAAEGTVASSWFGKSGMLILLPSSRLRPASDLIEIELQ